MTTMIREDNTQPEQGIALSLAQQRAQAIENVRYELLFTVPATLSKPVLGRAIIRLFFRDASHPLILDFAQEADFVTAIFVRGRHSAARFVNGHIVIPSAELTAGEMEVEIVFRAGEAPLNRNSDFMYTLFVPARAHHAFPCFDQPDLKARFTLELVIPAAWKAVANAPETSREILGEDIRIRFAETQPISTYLFAFAAGNFEVETAERAGRTCHMFHRETDAGKVARNRETLFDLHAASLEWLERYTGIPYPFDKFDFALLPAFQFSGMEHPGAIYYNASQMLLDESATETLLLGRALLIAHETAHMWFGDLVTMRWFDDVWLKEVFANFFADKVVNPFFPGVNHDLRFFLAHYPAAYSVDRTAGAHPIRQELENLNEAGGLYGPIIYHKAPIVMRQLERILGSDALREGVRRYLSEFSFGNAAWNDLIALLNENSAEDLLEWSRVWVEEPGRPSIRVDPEAGGRATLIQADPDGESRLWRQEIQVDVGAQARVIRLQVKLSAARTPLDVGCTSDEVRFVLPTGGGLAYADATLDDRSRRHLVKDAPRWTDPLARGAAYVTLWEELQAGRVSPASFLDFARSALSIEDVEPNAQLLLGYVVEAFWRFISPQARSQVAASLERTLQSALADAQSPTLKATIFWGLRLTFTTAEATTFFAQLWHRESQVPGLPMSESLEAAVALELATRSAPQAEEMLQTQLRRFTSSENAARLSFLTQAVSPRAEERDQFFRRLMDSRNRRREPWALEGLRYLHHPLRAAASMKYLRPGLDLLQEIQRTGDIFFPRNWMAALLYGHNTGEAAEIVRQFLEENPGYPVRLRRIILQAADPLFRAAALLK